MAKSSKPASPSSGRSSGRIVALPGSQRHPVAGARAVGPTNPNEWIEVTIKVRRQQVMPELAPLRAVAPKSRDYLTRDQLSQRYGAAPEDLKQVEAFARQQGLTVMEIHPGRRSVMVAGPASLMAQAFGVKLVQYSSPDGAYRGRVGSVHLPQDLEARVTGVFGLDNRRQARPRIVWHPLPPATSRASAARPWFTPPELASLYDFPDGDGSGQCVGILEFGGGFAQADLTTYFGELKIKPPQVVAVSVDHAQNRPGVDKDSDGEVMLDIEVVGSLVPRAKLAVYFSSFTEKGWVDVLDEAIHDRANAPSVLSISWGFSEGQMIWTPGAMAAVNDALQEAAAVGVTICAASGDDGSSDDQDDGHAHVDFPASSPFVLGVGGTTLKRSGAKIQSEVVWNGGPRQTADGSGGGGISESQPVPDFQSRLTLRSANPGHPSGRGVPDVAANADPRTGYFVRSNGQEGVAGGTSAAAPLWASLIARINQQLPAPVGYLNPLLYGTLAAQNVCRDITQGNNDTTGMVGGYAAKRGWDACTGWGSPSGKTLLKKLQALKPPKS